jgi:uncharacterized protein
MKNELLSRAFNVQVLKTVSDPDEPILEFIVSTGSVDRYQEVIDPMGWRLENYLKNPVFQNAHRYNDVMFTLGRALETRVVPGPDGEEVLWQRIEFAVEVNPLAKVAYGLYAGGFLKAVSVGFIPIRWEDGDAKTPWRRRYLEQELLEVSAVAVPANPEALTLALGQRFLSAEDLQKAATMLAVAGGEAAICGGQRRQNLLGACRELAEIMRAARS